MAQILLDTDVLISILRGNESVVHEMEGHVNRGEGFSYSPITVLELWQGIRPREETPTRQLLKQMQSFPMDDSMGRLAGQFSQQFGRSHGVTLPDALIAATAVLHRVQLWTLNKRHYPMPDIQLV